MDREHRWIEEMGQGSEQALAQLYGAYAEKVYNTLISYTKNEEDAQELTQDVFLTLFRSASQFRFDSSVSTWVYRIAVNKALDFLRKQNAAKRQGVFTSLFTRSGEVWRGAARAARFSPPRH